MKKKYHRIVQEVFLRKAQAAHSEKCHAMLADGRKDVRAAAVTRIRSVRKRGSPQEVRRFEIPKDNFQADDYTNLINWNSTEVFGAFGHHEP